MTRVTAGARWREPAAVGALLAAAACVYLWKLGQTGWGNAYYSAAAQAGAADWTAFLYGSSDAGNAITVDKPPASIWLMSVSARLFGLSPASVLLPEAILGIATVAVTYAIVRRHFGVGAGLLAGTIFAGMPASTLIFRYNNPDALLVFLVSVGLYATVRAIEDDRVRWMVLIGVVFGLAFLTKQLQAFLVVPAVAGVYLWAGPGLFRHRLGRGLIAVGFVLLSAGWWVAIVMFVPSGARPWIGGTVDDNFLSLTLGYNGLGRIFGGRGNGTSGAHTGLDRMFTGQTGLLIGWLLPAAIALGAIALIKLRSVLRNDAPRATAALLMLSMVSTLVALSFMSGIYHPYYSIAAGPCIAGSAAIGASMLWATRRRSSSRIVLAVIAMFTAIWGAVLASLIGAPFVEGLQWAILITGVAGSSLILAGPPTKAATSLTVALTLAAVLAGPIAVSFATASVGHSGSAAAAVRPNRGDGSRTLGIDPAVRNALASGGNQYRWAAATTDGSNTAARYQLANGHPVMAIGGYKRSDPAPTLKQFQQYVHDQQVHWFIGSGSGSIGAWVRANFAARTLAGVTLYDLTTPSLPASASFQGPTLTSANPAP